MKSPFLCPVCRQPLREDGRSLLCPGRHCFDRAAEGYVNLAVGMSRSGDSPEMGRARRDFLAAGYYRPLAETLGRLLTAGDPPGFVVDAGCGEGYYLRVLRGFLPDARLIGLDLAKTSVRLAARAERGRPLPIEYAVAGIFSMPLPDGIADAVLSVFAPIPAEEAHRILKPDGLLVAVHPGERHLDGLKSLLYEHPYDNVEKSPEPAGFIPLTMTRCRYTALIRGEDLPRLFAMTPYYWKTAKEDAARLTACESLETTLDFLISLYRRT